MVKYLIHFWVNFYIRCEIWFNSIYLHEGIQFSQHHLTKRMSFPHCTFLGPSLKSSWVYMGEFESLLYKTGFIPVKVKVIQSCLTLFKPRDYSSWNYSHNTGVGSLFLLQRIFLTQGLNSSLPHNMHILYQLSHKWSLYQYHTVLNCYRFVIYFEGRKCVVPPALFC